MKSIHNVRISSFSKDELEREKIKSALVQILGEKITPQIVYNTLTEQGLDPLYTLSFVIDKQPLVRLFMNYLLENFSQASLAELYDHAHLRIDNRGNYSFRISKDSLLNNNPQVALFGEVVQIKLTLAAFPKTPEQSLIVAQQIFSSQQI